MKAREAKGRGGIVADEMGLGKTIQAVELIRSSWLAALKSATPSSHATLVVIPLAVQRQWVAELKRFAPELSSSVIVYKKARGVTVESLSAASVVLVTYGLLRRELSLPQQRRLLLTVKWYRVILDEAHTIRNRETDVAKAVFLLHRRHKFSLCGTPLVNGLSDLASQCEFLGCVPQNDPKWWTQQAEDTSDDPTVTDSATRTLALADLHSWRETTILRRTKAVALVLPRLDIQLVTVPLSSNEAEQYAEMLCRAKQEFRDLQAKKVGKDILYQFLVLLILRLRQLSCDPRLLEARTASVNIDDVQDEVEKEKESVGHRDEISKAETVGPDAANVGAKTLAVARHLSALIKQEATAKVLVFSQWTRYMDFVQEQLEKRGIVYERYDGTMGDDERERRMVRFQKNPSVKVFLISLHAGGLGLNLPQANHVYLLDQWFNSAAEEQAISRAHRNGQTRPVTVYRFITNTSIEKCMMQLKTRKQNTASVCVDGVVGLPYRVLEGIFSELLHAQERPADTTSDCKTSLSTALVNATARPRKRKAAATAAGKKAPPTKRLSQEAKMWAQCVGAHALSVKPIQKLGWSRERVHTAPQIGCDDVPEDPYTDINSVQESNLNDTDT